MRRDVLHVFCRDVVKIDIRIGGCVWFRECNELRIVRNVAELVADRVLIDQLPLEAGGVQLIDIEEPRVSLVCGYVESLAVVRPSKELSLELVARRQILLFAVRVQHIEVVVLVAALIVRVQNSRVIGKVAYAESTFRCRASELLRLAAGDRNAVDIVDSALVARKQYRLLVRRE